jgi:hypothetical protein
VPSSLPNEGTDPSSGSGQGIDIPVDPDTSSGVTTTSSSGQGGGIVTTTTSSSGQGGSAPACGGQTACTSCIISTCSTEFAACGNDVPCCCFLDCLDQGNAQTDCTNPGSMPLCSPTC